MTCRFGLDPKICSLLSDFRLGLKEIAQSRENYSCAWCPPRDPEAFFQLLEDPRFREAVQELPGFDFFAEKVPGFLSKPFFCDLLDTQVTVPCQLTDCRYHTRAPFVGNCLRQITDTELSAATAAFYLGLPKKEAETTYKNAMRKLRFVAIQNALDSGEIKPMSYERTSCVRCGASFKSPLVKWEYGLGYCSKSCKRAKPASVVNIEYEFGADIVSLFRWAAKTFNTMDVFCETLGLSVREADRITDGYIYTDHEVVIKDLEQLRYARRKLNRRVWTVPKTGAILKGTTSYLKNLVATHGDVSESTSPVLYAWSLFFANLTTKG